MLFLSIKLTAVKFLNAAALFPKDPFRKDGCSSATLRMNFQVINDRRGEIRKDPGPGDVILITPKGDSKAWFLNA